MLKALKLFFVLALSTFAFNFKVLHPYTKVLRVLMRAEANSEIMTEGATDVLAAHVAAHTRLNTQQCSVFQREQICTVQLVHGPPGTGKTSVIDSYLQSPARKPLWLKAGPYTSHLFFHQANLGSLE